jgi:tRNA modification GTPase
MLSQLTQASAVLRATVATASTGRRLQDGARVVLWGAPNAGKSTLLNTLVGHERALVHDEPGTTRDALDVSLDVGGVPVVVVDVAGVRDGAGIHPVEARGIERARAEVQRADVVVTLWPADGPPPPPLPADTTAAIVRVRSKADLGDVAVEPVDVDVVLSARRGDGVAQLLSALTQVLVHDDGEPPLVHTARQEQALLEAAHAVDDALVALSTQLPDELVCSELRRAARGLDRLLGTDVGSDVLELVFSRFCIGK